jgi:NNP family nitrate/nitrite transporter-like MFS transporter
MLPLYLVTDRGIDRNWANTIIAISRVSGLGIAFLSGWISDRIGPAKTMAGVFFITGIFTVLLGLIPGSSVLVLVFLQPLTAVCFFPPAFSALSLIGPEATRNVAVSLTIPLGFLIGAGAVPIGIGVAGDAGSFPAGIAILGCLIFSGAFLTRRLVLRERD